MKNRDKEKCYNCLYFAVDERGKGTAKFSCERFKAALVGAGWCKYYKPLKETEQ